MRFQDKQWIGIRSTLLFLSRSITGILKAHAKLPGRLAQQREIEQVIIIEEQHLPSLIPPLSDMVRATGHHNARSEA